MKPLHVFTLYSLVNSLGVRHWFENFGAKILKICSNLFIVLIISGKVIGSLLKPEMTLQDLEKSVL